MTVNENSIEQVHTDARRYAGFESRKFVALFRPGDQDSQGIEQRFVIGNPAAPAVIEQYQYSFWVYPVNRNKIRTRQRDDEGT